MKFVRWLGLFLTLASCQPEYSFANTLSLLGAGPGSGLPPSGVQAQPCDFVSGVYSSGTITFSSRSICSASSDRIVVVVADDLDAVADISSITVGGSGLTEANHIAIATVSNTDVWYAAIPSGATASITINSGNVASTAVIGIQVFALTNFGVGGIVYNTGCTFGDNTAGTTVACTLTEAVASSTVCYLQRGAGGGVFSLTGITQYTAQGLSGVNLSGGYNISAGGGSNTPTWSISSNTKRAIACSNFK